MFLYDIGVVGNHFLHCATSISIRLLIYINAQAVSFEFLLCIQFRILFSSILYETSFSIPQFSEKKKNYL